MDNPETQATLYTQDKGQRQKHTAQHRNIERCATRTPPKDKGWVNQSVHEGQEVPASYKTSVLQLLQSRRVLKVTMLLLLILSI